MLYDVVRDTTDVDTKEFLDIDKYLEELSPRSFLSIIEQLVNSTFSRESLSDFHKDHDDVDQVHSFLCQFLDTMTTYLELKNAIKYGDIDFLRRLFPRLAVIFAGSTKIRYTQLFLYMTWLTSTTATNEKLQRAILLNSLVNTSDDADNFYKIDRLNEFTNYKLKLLMRSRSSTEPLKDLFRRMALTSHYNAVMKEDIELLCGEHTNNDCTDKDISDDLFRLAHFLHSQDITRKLEVGRKSDFIVTNLVVKGAEAIPDKVDKFNDIYALDEDDDDHLERISVHTNDESLSPDAEAVESDDKPVELNDFVDVINANELSTLAELAMTTTQEEEDI
ncbi:hypothetical protein KEM56_005050 [Ascosphaera pollenicola]|nr:hypothetical protein KEM56_005050 [Ascosphaera pollenicola]